ncbi:MAG: MCP four helix bundle domain-containing protein, partial [Opitutus sp.]
MRLQAKLTAAFALVAIITLGVAVFAWWKVTTLGSAIYEVAAVRLPSIQGLHIVTESVLVLGNSERLLSTGTLSPAERRGEWVRQDEAWRNFESGWKQYEPLPQTIEEAALWRQFTPTARNWQQSYRAAMARFGSETPVTRVSAEEVLLPHRQDF